MENEHSVKNCADKLKLEIKRLEEELEEKNKIISSLKSSTTSKLTNNEINRYSRQIILPCLGVHGQEKLLTSSVLIVGAGGLGCPSATYLAGAGVGHIGIIDYDIVEVNNLHRQLLHTENSIGQSKVDSVVLALKQLNSSLKVTPYHLQINSENALSIIQQYDVVLDASDNVATRYLLNDACILSSKPLVSGSALQLEGQLTVYNFNNGPCYRCIFPKPPPPEAVTNCGDGGVLGVIPGVIGVLQALEAIKIITNQEGVLSSTLLLFDGSNTTFRNIFLRSKVPDCCVCGINPTITNLIDYEVFCGAKANDKNPNLTLLKEDDRISVDELSQRVSKPMVIVDVRSKGEFEICRLPGSINVPINNIKSTQHIETISLQLETCKKTFEIDHVPVYVICRRGNDSQKAVLELQKSLQATEIKDVIGGLHEWARRIDVTFPVY